MARSVTPSEFGELMRLAFSHIAPHDDWKGGIDAVVPWDAANIYGAAVSYVTATTVSFGRPYRDERGNMVCRMTATGYRMGPAGP